MRKGDPIHCYEAASRRFADDHQCLTVRVQSPSVLQLSGVLDVGTRDLLQAVLDELHSPDLHLDVAGIDFADAAGLGVLARADAARRSAGVGRVQVHRASDMLQRTLRAAGLQRLLPWSRKGDEEPRWRPFALCRDEPGTLFFEDADPLPARRLCWSCPVSGNCLSYALRTRQAFGVWGALTAQERAILQGVDPVPSARRKS